MAQTFRYSNYITSTGFATPLLVVMNQDTFDSGRTITILNASAKAAKSQVASGQGSLVTQRISSLTGGNDIGITKADTSNANLPSQVEVKINADVTITAGTIYNSQLNLPVSPTINGPFGFRATGQAYNLSNWWATSRGEGSTQHLTLLEGEGIAITQINTTPAIGGVFQLVGTIKIGTFYYYINAPLYAREFPTASIAIMNNTGSGVTVELVSIEINEIGIPSITSAISDAPYVGYKRIDGYNGGEEVTPFAYDSSDTLPSQIKVVKNRLHLDMVNIDVGSRVGAVDKYSYGYPSSNMLLARSAGLVRQTLNYIADVMNVGVAAFPASGLKPRLQDFDLTGKISDFQGLVLRGGEGFAIQAMNMSHYSVFYIEIEFIHTPPAPVSGGLKSTIIVT